MKTTQLAISVGSILGCAVWITNKACAAAAGLKIPCGETSQGNSTDNMRRISALEFQLAELQSRLDRGTPDQVVARMEILVGERLADHAAKAQAQLDTAIERAIRRMDSQLAERVESASSAWRRQFESHVREFETLQQRWNGRLGALEALVEQTEKSRPVLSEVPAVACAVSVPAPCISAGDAEPEFRLFEDRQAHGPAWKSWFAFARPAAVRQVESTY